MNNLSLGMSRVRRNGFACAAIVLFSILQPKSHANDRWVYQNGNDLMEGVRAFELENPSSVQRLDAVAYLSYIMGVLDASAVAQHEGMKAGQAAAVVAKYLKEHPERWDKRGAVLVMEAITRAAAKRDSDP